MGSKSEETIAVTSTDAAATVPEATHSPLFRNFVHFGVFLIFFPPLAWVVDPRNGVKHGDHYAAVFLFVVTIFNLYLLRGISLGRKLYRPGEGTVTGLWLYPFSIGLSLLVFPPFAAMGGWAAMAGGDAAASFLGRLLRGPKLPWNKQKTFAGLLGFCAAAFPVCWAALYLCPALVFLKKDGSPELPFVWTLACLAAISGAIVESLDSKLDDNLRVPLSVSAVLALSASALSWATRGLPAHTHVQPEFLIDALIVNAIAGALVLVLRFADLRATLLGVVLGVVIYFFTHAPGYTLFIAFVFFGSVLSRIGMKRKLEVGAAEERGGKRGASNVAANLLVPAGCCLLYPLYAGHPVLLMAYAGALTAAFADTASSEIGTLARSEPFLITTMKRVPHGTNGGVSLLGFVGAICASATMAVLAWQSQFFVLLSGKSPLSSFSIFWLCVSIVLGGMCGTLVDSLLGATVEDRWPGVKKGVVNFVCTLSGAMVAGACTSLFFTLS